MAFDRVAPFVDVMFSEKPIPNAINILGFGFDGTTSFRPGSRNAPNAIREASLNLESYSPYQDRDVTDLKVVDLGNVPFYPARWDIMNDIFNEELQNIDFKKDNFKLITLGGEHSISYGPIMKYMDAFSDLLIVHLDAHADLRDGYLEAKYSHASIIRRILDNFKDGHELIQYGIRSGTRDEFKFIYDNNLLATSLDELLAKIDSSNRPIYLTLDLDFFDPSFFPGTGTPEAGGESFNTFIKIIKSLRKKNFVGADIVELAPVIDPTGNSNCFASKIVREVILAL